MLRRNRKILKYQDIAIVYIDCKISIVLSYDILSKQYRCVWRKARRINCYRAFWMLGFFLFFHRFF